MRRTGFDEHRDQQVANEYLATNGTCRQCGAGSERKTLSDYGGLCGTCFSDYCTGGKRNPPMPTLAQKVATLERLRNVMTATKHPHSWAHRLQAKREQGQPLSVAQRACLEAFERSGKDGLLVAASDRVVEAARMGQDVPRQAMTDALRASGDLPWDPVDEANAELDEVRS